MYLDESFIDIAPWNQRREEVSTFYGPGFFVAWLLSAVSSLIRLRSGEDFDFEAVGVALYPAIALMHLWSHVLKFSDFNDSYDATFIAASGVVRVAFALYSFALASLREQEKQREQSNEGDHPGPGDEDGWGGYTNRAVLLFLLRTMNIFFVLTTLVRTMVIYDSADIAWSPSYVLLVLGMFIFMRSSPSWNTFWMTALQALFLESFITEVPVFPPGCAKITDIDQLAIFFLSVVVFATRLLRTIGEEPGGVRGKLSRSRFMAPADESRLFQF
jgi:hypothetical protein